MKSLAFLLDLNRLFLFAVTTLVFVTPLYQGSNASAQVYSTPPDTDGDGVTDGYEWQDGTDPNSPDSVIEHVDSTYCVDWNGFIDDTLQVMELRNAGCTPLDLQIQLRDSFGAVQGSTTRTLAPIQQFDLVANALNGFVASAYGTLCATIQNGETNTLDARLSTYNFSFANSYRYAFSTPAAVARTGSQYLGFNNYFPTLNPLEFASTVEGWVQVSSDEQSFQTGELIFYSPDGIEIRRSNVRLSARGRYDTGTLVVGAATAGGVEWRPTDPTKKFRVVQNRYYRRGSATSAYAGVIAIPARRPTGHLVASPFRTDSRLAVVELTNALSSGITVSAAIYSSAGTLLTNQPPVISIPPKGTTHLILNRYLPNGTGKVQFSASQPQSLASTVIEYGLDTSLRFAFANMHEPKSGFGRTQRTSYNNFLGDCNLRFTNLTNAVQTTQVATSRADGTTVPTTTPLHIAANSTTRVELCSNDTPNNYGGVILTPQHLESLVAEVIRENIDGSSEFNTTASERSVCHAGLQYLTPSVLSIPSNGSAVIQVQNTSPTITATNVQALLPAGWGDVTVNPLNCGAVPPGGVCSLQFNSGNTTHAAATFSILGDNTIELLATISVDPVQTAVISLAGSPLTLTANGPSGVLTITNLSPSVTALNVVSDFTGTALDGLVTETGNTCASLPPSASCALTFTPGSSTVSSTNFTVQGTNTNTVSAAIEIASGSTLTGVSPNSGASAGGTGVTLTGTGLTGATAVTFDGVAATSVNVISSTTVTAVTPAHAAGVVDVAIATPAGGATYNNGYTYVATAVGQPSNGGTIACLNGGLNNLVGASVDNSVAIAWGGFGIATGASSTSDGASNTSTIVVSLGNNGGVPYAAKLCSDYEIDSQGNTPCQVGNACYNDWFLPASLQLDCLYTNAVSIGGFSPNVYWSSTESVASPATNAQAQSFAAGITAAFAKVTGNQVRCVRQFVP